MRTTISIILLSLIQPSFSQNPISPQGVYIADPSARVMPDGKLYVYGSNDESRQYYCSNTHHVLSSSDMTTWEIKKDIFMSKGVNDKVSYSDCLLYAPDCIEKEGKYYMYYCMSDGSEGVSSAKYPYGPFGKGKKLPASGIDPAVFIDDDGQAYYYWGQINAKAARLTKDMSNINVSSIKENIVTEKEHRFHEGSWVFKRKGIYYYVYTAINKMGEATSIDYSTSTSPLGPFKYGGTIIDNTGCDPCSWNNHGSVVEYKGEWYVFYHRSTHASNMMRKACVERISFAPDGSIPQVEMTSQGAGEPLDGFKTIDACRACLLSGKIRITQSGPNKEELSRIEHYNSAIYKYIRFERAPTNVTIKVAPQNGGKVQFFTDSHIPLATINVPSGDGKTYKEFSAKVNGLVQGTTLIKVRFYGNEDKDLMKFDSFRFE